MNCICLVLGNACHQHMDVFFPAHFPAYQFGWYYMTARSAVQQKSNWSLIPEQSNCSGGWMVSNLQRCASHVWICLSLLSHRRNSLCWKSVSITLPLRKQLCLPSAEDTLLQREMGLFLQCFPSVFTTCMLSPSLLNCSCGLCWILMY